MKYTSLPYEEITLGTKVLEVHRVTCQRFLNWKYAQLQEVSPSNFECLQRLQPEERAGTEDLNAKRL